MTYNLYFYQSKKLAMKKKGDLVRTIVQTPDTIIAENVHGSPNETSLLRTDDKKTVINTASKKEYTHNTFTAFGYFSKTPLSLLGFNGELIDYVLSCYLLGMGHRLYSPSLMRFSSADIESPFGLGGLNAYSYCHDDPVNRLDPSGKFSIFKFFRGEYSPTHILRKLEAPATNNPKSSSITERQLRIVKKAARNQQLFVDEKIKKYESLTGPGNPTKYSSHLQTHDSGRLASYRNAKTKTALMINQLDELESFKYQGKTRHREVRDQQVWLAESMGSVVFDIRKNGFGY